MVLSMPVMREGPPWLRLFGGWLLLAMGVAKEYIVNLQLEVKPRLWNTSEKYTSYSDGS